MHSIGTLLNFLRIVARRSKSSVAAATTPARGATLDDTSDASFPRACPTAPSASASGSFTRPSWPSRPSATTVRRCCFAAFFSGEAPPGATECRPCEGRSIASDGRGERGDRATRARGAARAAPASGGRVAAAGGRAERPPGGSRTPRRAHPSSPLSERPSALSSFSARSRSLQPRPPLASVD